MTTSTPAARRPGWVAAFLAAAVAVLVGIGAGPAPAVTPTYAYDPPSYVYDAPAQSSTPNVATTYAQGSPAAPVAVSRGTSVVDGDCCTAANTADQVAAAVPRAVHGNSASSSATAYLYRLSNAESGAYLKTGISQNLMTRYTRTFMQDKERSGGDGPGRGTRAGPRCRRAAVRPLEPSPRRTVASPGPIRAESSSSPT